MGLFKRKKTDGRAATWGWDPAEANVSGEQAWALLTNAIYFRSVAPRLDTLGGGLEGLDWLQGLSTFWDVHNDAQYDELVNWMQSEGHRAEWAAQGRDGGETKIAWDYCRLITVSGGAALARVISSERAWDMVMAAGDQLFDRFDSWGELADNYLTGRILWLQDRGQWEPEPDPSQAQFEAVASELFVDPNSPWNRVDWDRSRGVMVDGEVF